MSAPREPIWHCGQPESTLQSFARSPRRYHPLPRIRGTLTYVSFEDNSTYNGATLTWQRRFVHGFFYTANYTYSKCIDDASQLNGASVGGINGLQNTRNLRGDRGRCDWDIPHQFTMNFSWMSPCA